jgi:hypothetical protein
MSNLSLRQSLKEIIDGKTFCEVLGKRSYIKHFSIFDQSDIEKIKDEYYLKAKSRGLPTEEESLNSLKEEKIWTDKDEAELLKLKLYIETLQKTKSNKFLIAEIKHLNDQIEEEEKKYLSQLGKKRELLGQTCEIYSENRVSELYILKSFFKDEECKVSLFDEEELNELEQEDLVYIIREYNKVYERFKEVNIQRIILSDFYTMYMPFCDDVMNYFNKPIFELSMNQVKLITYSKMFKNIFERYSDIPPTVRQDPEKIFEFINSKEKGKKVLENMDKGGASTVVGAKKEDYENMGVKGSNSKSLSEMLRKNKGKMDMNDIMKVL